MYRGTRNYLTVGNINMFLTGLVIGAVSGTIAGLFVWEKVDNRHWSKKTKESFYQRGVK